MSESWQKQLSRVRPPRVQITYDVETGGAIEKKELPLVVGILADLAGTADPDNPRPFLRDRKFIEIDRDNFNDVMQKIAPRLKFTVNNPSGNGTIPVEMTFAKLDDFRPESVVQQQPSLKTLFDARRRLNDLVSKVDGNDELSGLLAQVAKSTEDTKPATTPSGGAAAGAAGAADGAAGGAATPSIAADDAKGGKKDKGGKS